MSTEPLTIRAMTEADTPSVHRIHTECLTRSLADHYSPAQLAAWMHGRSPQGYWHFANAGETFRVAELSGEVIAFANWRDRELRSLFVLPEHQRSGIGARLFAACAAEAPLDFVKATASAVGFYERFGFVAIGPGFDLKRDVRLPHIAMRRVLQP